MKTIVEPFQLPVCVCGETRPSSTPAAPVPQSSTASKPVGLNCHPLSSRLSITERGKQLVEQLHLTETPEGVVVIALFWK